jgi:hypothetical protein
MIDLLHLTSGVSWRERVAHFVNFAMRKNNNLRVRLSVFMTNGKRTTQRYCLFQQRKVFTSRMANLKRNYLI